jgi:hypothetical protein
MKFKITFDIKSRQSIRHRELVRKEYEPKRSFQLLMTDFNYKNDLFRLCSLTILII